MPAGRQNLNGNWFAGLRPKVITCELERQVKGRGKPNKRMEGSREKHPTNNLLWVTFLEDLEQYDKEELSLVAVANKPNANLSLQGGSNCFPNPHCLLLLLLASVGQCWPPLETLSDRMTSNCFKEDHSGQRHQQQVNIPPPRPHLPSVVAC